MHPVEISRGLVCPGQLWTTCAVPSLYCISPAPFPLNEELHHDSFSHTKAHPNARWQLSGMTGAFPAAGMTWQPEGSLVVGDKVGQPERSVHCLSACTWFLRPRWINDGTQRAGAVISCETR